MIAWTLILGTAALSGLVDCLPDALPDIRPVGPVFVSVSVSDPVEHESSHELHSQLRKRFGNPTVYVGEGKAVVVPSIRGLTLRAVADAVLPSNRGSVYSLYMRQAQRWWNDEPCYVLDEHGSYLNGTLWYRSRGRASDAAYSLDRAAELASYADTLLMLAKRQPGYDATQLAALLDYQRGRLEKMRTNILPSSAGAADTQLGQPVDDAARKSQPAAVPLPAPPDDPWSKTIVVAWSAKWCGPCKTYRPLWDRLRTRPGVTVYELDVDDPAPTWAPTKPASVPDVQVWRARRLIGRWRGAGHEAAIEAAANEAK